jgi:hypothetical protein
MLRKLLAICLSSSTAIFMPLASYAANTISVPNNTGNVIVNEAGGAAVFGGNGSSGALIEEPFAGNYLDPTQQFNFLSVLVMVNSFTGGPTNVGIHCQGTFDIEGSWFHTEIIKSLACGGDGGVDTSNNYYGGGGGGCGGRGGDGGAAALGFNNYGGSNTSYWRFLGGGNGGSSNQNRTGDDHTSDGGGVLVVDAVGPIIFGPSSYIAIAGENGDEDDVNFASGVIGAGGGGAGGEGGFYSQTSINVASGAWVNATGGNGGNGTLLIPGANSSSGGGGGAGGQIFLMAPSITVNGLLDVQHGTAGTSAGGSLATPTDGADGQTFQVTAVPTIPLVYESPKYTKIYAEIAQAKDPEKHDFKMSSKEWVEFIAACKSKNQQEFINICNNLNNNEPTEPVVMADLVPSNAS